MSSKNVIVIGGGLAGLAAGVALADVGCRVRLFEQRPYLGGRATSYVLPNGEHVDNCQHVTFGCCTNLEDFYQRAGVQQSIRYFDHLLLLDPQDKRGTFHASPLPAPLHLIGSFLTFAPLNIGERLAVARAMMSIFRWQGRPPELRDHPNMSMQQWLEFHRQPPRAMERFWRAVLVSALSEEMDRIDARYGLDVFWKTVLSNRTGYRMGVPSVPLAELYDGCRAAIEKKGGEVILRSPVRSLRLASGALAAAVFDEGREENGDAFILALPHDKLNELLPDEVRQANPGLGQIENIKDSPITGVHLWFDRQVMREPFLTLLDTQTQWIFNKSALYGAAANNAPDVTPSEAKDLLSAKTRGQYLQLVISASYDFLRKSREEIIDLCLKEVRRALPAAREAQLVKATVIKEAAATFSPEPGVDQWRPAQETKTPGLYLAGDWTATGWPATMESAVRSGYLAAEAVLRSAGVPQKFLQPDLPASGLSRFFA